MAGSDIRLVALGVTTTLALMIGAGSAHGTQLQGPEPNSGPVSGGTVVTVPAPEEGLFVELQAGGVHSLGLDSDGKAYSWGANYTGALGNDELESEYQNRPVPVLAPEGVRFTQLGAGLLHSFALTADGTPYAWGANSNGQIGNGANVDVPRPVALPLPGGTPVTQIVGGMSFTVALDESGRVYTWGENSHGQLGNGSTDDSNTPVPVIFPEDVVIQTVRAGSDQTFALTEDGVAYAWGRGSDGRLGNGATDSSPTPVAVTMPANVRFTDVQAGRHHAVALGEDGNVYSWGDNSLGQLGHGELSVDVATPTLVEDVNGMRFAEIALGGETTLAKTTEGAVYGWGENPWGELGIGEQGVRLRPVPAFPLEAGVEQISMSLFHTMVLGSDGLTYVAGYNFYGQLGVGPAPSSVHNVTQLVTDATVTGILFDGVEGTGLQENATGWQATTPEHAAGPVDVTTVWEQVGQERTRTFENGFTYVAPEVAPTVSNPESVTVTEGESASFAVTVGGTPAPGVAWQESADGGQTWRPVRADATVATSGGRSTLTLRAALDDSGLFVRVLAANEVTSAVSEHAVLTVTAIPAVVTPQPPTRPLPASPPPLAVTGASAGWSTLVVLGSLLAAAGLSLLVTQRLGRRRGSA